ncbi:hypothetical protein TNCV_4693221 [Trichonephila clavipes]|nr:hypothetical protein TNCV_4693221 [Trichonephila clavipes]
MRNLRQYHSVTQEIVCGRAKHDRPLTCHNWESSKLIGKIYMPGVVCSSLLIGRANRWGNCLGLSDFCDHGGESR